MTGDAMTFPAGAGTVTVPSAAPAAKPVGGGVLTGLFASLCCGGSVVFASIGLGAFYSALGLGRYIPQALALGSLAIVAINWLFYRRRAERLLAGDPVCDCGPLRRAMLLSAFIGLVAMAGSFVLMEWLNHAVVNAARMMIRPEYAEALVPGVPNYHLVYLALTFLALPLLAVLPLPRARSAPN